MPDQVSPCPFCGGSADFAIHKKTQITTWLVLYCKRCQATSRALPYDEFGEPTRKNAETNLRAVWNRRAA